MRELSENQKKHSAKHNLGLTIKLTNPLYTQKIGHIAGVNRKMSSEKLYKKHMEKVSNRRRKNRNKKRIHQQGHNSKVLVIYCISIESDSMDIKLMELKL